MYKIFKAIDAVNISNSIKQNILSKGNIIDMIRAAAKKGKFDITVERLSKDIAQDLYNNHGFNINKNKISWIETYTKKVAIMEKV